MKESTGKATTSHPTPQLTDEREGERERKGKRGESHPAAIAINLARQTRIYMQRERDGDEVLAISVSLT